MGFALRNIPLHLSGPLITFNKLLDSSLPGFLTCTSGNNIYLVHFMQQDKVPSMVGGTEWILNLILRMVLIVLVSSDVRLG